MSERKGGHHKIPRKTVKIGENDHAKLLKYAQSKKLKMGIILTSFIDKGVEFDIHDPGWIDKLQRYTERVNAFAGLDGACDGLAYGVDEKGIGVYSCVWFNDGAPPSIKILGKTEELQAARCAACGRTEEVRRVFREKDNRISELEHGLKSRATEVFKVPVCNGGAVLSAEGREFRGCRKGTPNKPVSIEKFCKVYSRGLPCQLYAEIVVGVGKKT